MPIYKSIKEQVKNVLKGSDKNASFLAKYTAPLYVNLCCGPQKIPGYIGVDFLPDTTEITLDLRYEDLPFKNNSVEKLICISAINYFKYERAKKIIEDIYRVIKPGGIVRFAVQDLEIIAKRYLEKDTGFFFQKLPDGRDRFPGATMADKVNAWFYGYEIMGNPCQYVYDYDSLAYLFKEAGFTDIEHKKYLESKLQHIELIDNRPEQMFFLEAIK
jgi:predicted SAM-dependent methyltransferase